jgi:hypothetical protein
MWQWRVSCRTCRHDEGYQLYGLTEEEIEVVEGKGNKIYVI